MAFITAATRSDIVELAMGMLNKAPSTTMLNTLVEKSAAGSTIQDLADYIATTDGFIAEYPSTQTAREFATEMFAKLITGGTLDATINTAVIDLLEGMLTAGTTKAEGFVAVIDYLSNTANNTNADLGDISKSFQNRADAAEYFSITKELGGSTDAELAAAISSVTSDAATLTAANAAADSTASAVPAVDAQTYTLTTALDNKTLGGGDDQAFAVNSDATALSDSFNVADKVDGGAGEDTFFLTVNDITGPQTYTPSRITNFEKLSVTNVDATPDAVTVDANLMGLTSIENSASSAGVVVSNVAAGATLAVSGASGATTLTVKGAGLTGLEDTANITLTGASGAVNYNSSTAQDIEKAAVTVVGANTSALTIQDSGSNVALTTVTVTGSGSWDMETGGKVDDALKILDASANTGGVTFTGTVATGVTLTGGAGNDTLTGAAGNDVVKGGEGDDTLTMGASGVDNFDGGAGNDTITVTGLTSDDSITGGDGIDTLAIGAAIAYDDEAVPTAIDDAINISGFELVRNTAAITQDMAAFTGMVGIQSTVGVFTATEASGIADYFALANDTGLDITLATDGTADNLNIHMGNAVAQTNSTGVTIDAIEIETALIASGGADSSTITDFEADALTALTITGSKSIAVTLNDSAAVTTLPLTKVDASAFTGSSLTVTAQEADSGVVVTTGSQALTVTVGDGANTVTGTVGDDSITTGSGADTITSSDGEDTISAGDGANTITVGDGNATVTGGEGVDTITAGNGNNTITLNDGADVLVAGKGNNTITNKAGNATITAGDGENNVTNTAGNSTITLGDGGNTVTLTAGNSTLVTGDLADTISVSAGNNNITAGGGNDTITLGSGNDTVDSGAGTDSVAFTVSSGTWSGGITNTETITPTFGGSASIDFTSVTGYTALTVSANDDTSTVTLKNLDAASITVSDDNAEDGANGDIEAIVIDTEADQAMTITIGANQEAAIATAADFTSLTLTDASSLVLGTTGGGFGNLLDHDIESLVLDDDETTSLTVGVAAYTSLETGAITGNESLESLTVEADATEADIIIDGMADGTNLSTLILTASGLNASIDINGMLGAAGEATDVILNTIAITASNGGDVSFTGNADGESATDDGDINTSEDADSVTMTATGVGSTITAGMIHADGLDMNEVTISASAGAVIDMEADAEDNQINYAYDKLSYSATGTGSTLNIHPIQDSGSLAATAEATLTLEADDGSTIQMGATSALGGVDLDTVTIHAGASATLDSQEATITASGDIGTLNVDFDAASNHTEAFDINTGKILTNMSVVVGAGAEMDTGAFLIELTDDAETEVGIYNLELDIADRGGVTTVDLEVGAATLDVGGASKISVLTVGETAGTYYQGSIKLYGDDNNIVLIGSTVALDAAELSGTGQTAGTEGVFGSWSVTTGTGDDTITGSPGADTITSSDGADTVSGGAGNDSLTSGNGADTVTPGQGTDSVILTEAVSAADIVVFNTDPEGAAGSEGDSEFITQTGEGNNIGEDTITTFTTGVDTIRIVGTDVGQFVHGTNTDLGDGTGTSTDDDGSEGFATNVGLINMNAETATDDFDDDGDVVVNFSSPTTTLTEALFEAALQYNITGTSAADTITTGGLADTIKGGLAADAISGGAGADVFIISSGLTMDTVGDFTAESDAFHFDLSDLETSGAVEAGATFDFITFAGTTAAPTSTLASTTVAVDTIADDSSNHATILGGNVIILHGGATTFATVADAVDAFEASGSFTITHHNNIAENDAFIFAYENSTTGLVTIAAANFNAADDHNGGAATIADNLLDGYDLVSLTGVTDVTTLTAVDFNFIT